MINGNLALSSLRLPSDDTPEEWRGRMRLVSADRTIPRRNKPLTEAERDAIEVWIPKGASILAYARGRLTREGCPVWVLSTQGALIMTLNDAGFDQIKARAEWLPASHLRRIDLDVDREFTLVRQGGRAQRVATAPRNSRDQCRAPNALARLSDFREAGERCFNLA